MAYAIQIFTPLPFFCKNGYLLVTRAVNSCTSLQSDLQCTRVLFFTSMPAFVFSCLFHDVNFFSTLFALCVSVWVISIDLSSRLLVDFSSAVSSLLMNLKKLLISCHIFYFQHLYLTLALPYFIFLLKFPICS